MTTFRLCNKTEVTEILEQRCFSNIGHKCEICPSKNNHKYLPNKNYLHFFEREISLLYLYLEEGKFICVYDIPDDILKASIGTGVYLDFINSTTYHHVTEYAIESEKIQFTYLKKVYLIKSTLDFDYFPSNDEIYDNLTIVYNSDDTHN